MKSLSVSTLALWPPPDLTTWSSTCLAWKSECYEDSVYFEQIYWPDIFIWHIFSLLHQTSYKYSFVSFSCEYNVKLLMLGRSKFTYGVELTVSTTHRVDAAHSTISLRSSTSSVPLQYSVSLWITTSRQSHKWHHQEYLHWGHMQFTGEAQLSSSFSPFRH